MRCRCGSSASAAVSTTRASAFNVADSGPQDRGAASARHPPAHRSPTGRNLFGSTVGPLSASSTGEVGRVRLSVVPCRRAMFARIWNTQVRRLDRPWNRSMPLITASQVSCTASSAEAWEATYCRATLIIAGDQPRTILVNAAPSPARSRSTRFSSPASTGPDCTSIPTPGYLEPRSVTTTPAQMVRSSTAPGIGPLPSLGARSARKSTQGNSAFSP